MRLFPLIDAAKVKNVCELIVRAAVFLILDAGELIVRIKKESERLECRPDFQ
jgi:hypothetical protein